MIEGVDNNDQPELFREAEAVRKSFEMHGTDMSTMRILQAMRAAYRLGMMRGEQLAKEEGQR